MKELSWVIFLCVVLPFFICMGLCFLLGKKEPIEESFIFKADVELISEIGDDDEHCL